MAKQNARGGWHLTDEEAAEVIRLSEQGSSCCGGRGGKGGDAYVTGDNSVTVTGHGGGGGGCCQEQAGFSVTASSISKMAGSVRGRLFKGYRPQPPAEYAEKGITNSGSEPDYEGIIFSDGTVAVRWLTQYRSTSTWASWEDFYQVHGHPEYGTSIIFD